MDSIKNKVAIVTGGSRGIGRAISLMLARHGCHVAFNYLNSHKEAAALENEIKTCKVKGKASQVDIKDYQQVKTWIENTRREMGGLDILINNAGVLNDKALMLMTDEEWRQVIDTNLNGVFCATRACIVPFLKQKSGRIINISSVSGIVGLPRQSNYAASKGGINAFTKSIAKEVAAYGVRVNAVAPGFIDTDMLRHLTDEHRQKILTEIPLGRIGGVDDVTACVKFLLSDQAAYITGQIIQVDGGLAM